MSSPIRYSFPPCQRRNDGKCSSPGPPVLLFSYHLLVFSVYNAPSHWDWIPASKIFDQGLETLTSACQASTEITGVSSVKSGACGPEIELVYPLRMNGAKLSEF